MLVDYEFFKSVTLSTNLMGKSWLIITKTGFLSWAVDPCQQKFLLLWHNRKERQKKTWLWSTVELNDQLKSTFTKYEASCIFIRTSPEYVDRCHTLMLVSNLIDLSTLPNTNGKYIPLKHYSLFTWLNYPTLSVIHMFPMKLEWICNKLHFW